MSPPPSIHANCVVIGEVGVLIRGASGAGKSWMSERLIERAAASGLFARLVADDRTRLTPLGGRLVASVPETIAGLIERRGEGIVRVDFQPEAALGLVVDLQPSVDPAPDADTLVCALEGVMLPRISVAVGDPNGASAVLARLDLERPPPRCVPFALAFAPQHEKIASSAWDAPSIGAGRAKSGGGR